MRSAIKVLLLLLIVGAIGGVVGRSVGPPQRPPTRAQVLADLGFERVVPEVNFQATPFDEAIDFLRQRTSTNVVVRWRVLEASGIDEKTPITLRVSKLPLRRVLELICEEAGGGTVAVDASGHDGAIVISTAQDNTRYAETKLYDVRDLVQAHYTYRVQLGWRATTQAAPNLCFGGPAAGTGGGGGGGSGVLFGAGGASRTTTPLKRSRASSASTSPPTPGATPAGRSGRFASLTAA